MGTRPEIIKMAPVYHELIRRGASTLLLHTGQQEDLAQPMYDFFEMQPDFNLHLNRAGTTLEHLSAVLIEKIGHVLAKISPRAVLVHGDTSSAFMTALSAFYHQIPVAHVEAGLRSGEPYDPFPEEKNRELISRLAWWHFAPTEKAAANLLREGIVPSSIRVVGNSVVDAVNLVREKIGKPDWDTDGIYVNDVLTPDRLTGRRVILVTAHRRENWHGPLLSIAKAVRTLIEQFPEALCVWPIHPNPTVKDAVFSVLGKLPDSLAERLILMQPLSYPALLDLLTKSWLVLTDSGGLQEEAATLKVPILVLRETTERPELIEVGGGRLVGTQQVKIVNAVRDLWTNPTQYDAMKVAHNPFGDGTTAKQIVDALLK